MLGLAFGILLALSLLAVNSPWALPWQELVLAILLAVVFLPFPFGGDIFPLNVPAWSLFYELVVNALFAFFYRLTNTWWLTLVVIASALSLLAGAVAFGTMNFGPSLSDTALALARTAFSFGVGVMLYRYRRTTAVHPFWILVAIAAIFAFPVPLKWRVWFDLLCVFAILPGLVFLLLGTYSSSATMNSVFGFLGAMSYGLYAVHYPLIWLARGVSEKFSLSLPVVGVMLIVTLIVVCGVTEVRVDRPLRGWLSKRLVSWHKGNELR